MLAHVSQKGNRGFAIFHAVQPARNPSIPEGRNRHMNIEFVVFRQQHFKLTGGSRLGHLTWGFPQVKLCFGLFPGWAIWTSGLRATIG